MGYTHYFYQKPSLPEDKFLQFTKYAKRLLVTPEAKQVICREYTQENFAPAITQDSVRFNGKGDEGHETFKLSRILERKSYLDPSEKFAFSFCKTARKPYDRYVTACLIIAKVVFGDDVKIGSDGETEDWQAGAALAGKALGYPVVATLDSEEHRLTVTKK